MWFDDAQSEAALRAAWRRVARALHPDARPGDPGAEERFKQARSAYDAALARVRRRPTTARAAPPPPAAPPARWSCPACGDGYTIRGRCPRCDVLLHDRRRGPAPAHHDPRVERLLTALAARGSCGVRRADDPSREVLRRAGSLAAMGVMGIAHACIGLVGVAALFAVFTAIGGALFAYDHYRRANPPAWLDLS